jgi:hypothetical protein
MCEIAKTSSDNGRWLIVPKDPPLAVRRRYRSGTLVLETEFETETGRAAIVDFMVPADGANLVRIVVGRSGRAWVEALKAFNAPVADFISLGLTHQQVLALADPVLISSASLISSAMPSMLSSVGRLAPDAALHFLAVPKRYRGDASRKAARTKGYV